MKIIPNYEELKTYFKYSPDVSITEFYKEHHYYLCIYTENQGNIYDFDAYYMPLINDTNFRNLTAIFPGVFNFMQDIDIKKISDSIFMGRILLFIDNEFFYEIVLVKKPLRTPEKSNLDPINLFGSSDGFVEDAQTNLALIRKRLKTTDLIVEELTFGETNKTTIYVTYLKEFNKYHDEIVKTIKTAEPKFPVSINSISKLFQKNSLMPMTLTTGYPENFSSALTEGRTGIILDNSPLGLIVPVNITSFSNMKNSVNTPAFYSILNKIFVLFFLVLSLFGLGFAVAIINFNPDSLTISLISNLKLTERGTSYTIFLEIIAVLLLFEFYRFAASRSSPSYVQNIIVILGSLFIGQNAINSGLIGPLILLITSMAYLSSYAFTNNTHMISAISNFRLFILICSHFLGMLGFFLASFLVIAYLSSLKSFDVPYLFPITPISKTNIKDFFIPRSKR